MAAEVEELAAYLGQLTTLCREVLVVDGSPAPIFEEHHSAWARFCRHEPVDRSFGYLNDKVNGIQTGVARASCEKIILADDDVRYSAPGLKAVLESLDDFEIVRPQNFIAPLPWWARMEAARMLINRATLRTGDYPGTCGFRRSAMLAAGHYDGDVLFDNEEMIRHFARTGLRIDYALDLFVRKRPPTFRKWLEQRPRQAYEDFPLRAKSALFFSLLPAILLSFLAGSRLVGCTVLCSLGAAAAGLALAGRGRGIASSYFPVSVCFFAPLWMIERTLSTYWALYWFLRHGGYPFGDKLLSKGVGRDWFAGAAAARPPHPERSAAESKDPVEVTLRPSPRDLTSSVSRGSRARLSTSLGMTRVK